MSEIMQISHETLVRRYDNAASRWQQKLSAMRYPENYRGIVQRFLLDFNPDWNVLDAGAGTGDFTQALLDTAGLPCRIDLLDISPDMLAAAKRYLSARSPNIETFCHPVEQLGKVGEYDLILCAHVVEHCPDHSLALCKIRAALKPGGRLLLVASKPHWCTTLLRVIWRHKAFHTKDMECLLAKTGFTNISPHRFPSGPASRTSAGYFATNPTT